MKRRSSNIESPVRRAAFAGLVLSVALWFRVSRGYGLYVGMWVTGILGLWVGVRVVLVAADVRRLQGK